MTDIPLTAASEPAAGSGRISLRTLVPIRWVAIAGQALAILTVHYGLGFHLPLVPALAVVAGSAFLNLVLIVYRQVARRLGERYASLCLGYDILQLAILLYLTGGLQNPFSILILAPVTVAATILSRRPVIVLSIFAVAAISALALWHLPLPWRTDPGPLVFPPEIIVGIWTALVLATLFIAGYTWSVAQDARRLARRGGGDPAGARPRAAGLGGRRPCRGGGARARQPARDDRGRRQGAGARTAARQSRTPRMPHC